jgi:hypothetical protein
MTLLLLPGACVYGQSVVTDPLFNYQLTLPATLVQHHYANESDSSKIYHDTTADVVLMISGRPSTFTDIKSYLDCSKSDMEKELRAFQGDTSLKLVECSNPANMPSNAAVLQFETNAYLPDFDRCYIYFLHYKSKEVQFFFLYHKTNFERSMEYIDNVMATLRLLES